MKHIFKLIFCIIITLFVFFDDSAYSVVRKKKKKIRAAATSTSKTVDSVSSKSSTKVKKLKSSVKAKSSGSKITKKSKTKKEEPATEQDADIKKKIDSSPEAKCLNEALPDLLENDCAYLNDEYVIKKMNQPLLCAYSFKTKSKVKSATEYLTTQKYGVKEVKKDASVTVKGKNPPSAYYQFLLDGLEDGSLKHTRILDSITEEVLEDAEESNDVIAAIENKSVESAKIVVDIVPNDVTLCQKAVKKVIQSCSAATSEEVQELIEGSCSEYESALMKQSAYLKNEVFDNADELIKVLKQRVPAKKTTEEKSSTDSTKTNNLSDAK